MTDVVDLSDGLRQTVIALRKLLDKTASGDAVARATSVAMVVRELALLGTRPSRVADLSRLISTLTGLREEVDRRRVLGNVEPGEATFSDRGPDVVAICSDGPGTAVVESKRSDN